MSEAQLQALVLEAAGWAGFLAFHDHDSRRNARGFPDLCMIHPRTGRLIFVELKSATGRIRPDQQKWLDALQKRHEAYLWRPADWTSGLIQRVLLGNTVARATMGA